MNAMLIVWRDLHLTNIPIIDEQHRAIVGIINSLFYFMRKHREADVIIPIVAMLEQYTKLHFLTEEWILKTAGYEHLAEHRHLHEALAGKMVHLRNKKNSDEILSFLKEWWTNHINMADHAYAPTVYAKLREMGEV